jgi:serine acetyltransferase
MSLLSHARLRAFMLCGQRTRYDARRRNAQKDELAIYLQQKAPPAVMDERGYVAEALFDRLRDDGVEHRVLDETEVDIAVARDVLASMPRRVARFCQDFDLQLVQLARFEPQAWQFVLAWSDEVGRPSFLTVKTLADYYRAGRRLLRCDELMSGTPDVLFLYGLAESVEAQAIDEARAGSLSTLWRTDPRGANERIARFWRERRHIRLIAQAAKHGEWRYVRAELAALRRALRRAVFPTLSGLIEKASIFLKGLVHPSSAVVAFVGADSAVLRERVQRDLAPAFPAGFTALEQDYAEKPRGIDVAVLFDPPDGYRLGCDETICVEKTESMAPAVLRVERALVRWLESRVERRNPQTVVGANPLAARILQFALRHEVPVLADFMSTLLNCGIYCRLRSPLLMPHPYGIFIHRNVGIGSRVTVMQQVAIGSKHPADPGVPVIEDNVYIGAGARILGPIRIGHGATVGANAVVTRDVPSHCTVVGVNRILGALAVAKERQGNRVTVVNT